MPTTYTRRWFIFFAAVFGFTAVAMGAFAAHGLHVSPERLSTFKTAAEYQMYHALALLGVGCGRIPSTGRWTGLSGGFFVTGILLFSGSLYLLVLADMPWLGAVTPFGGIAFMAGWLALAMAALRGEFAEV